MISIKYVVIRVGDEFVIDLMKAACGVEYNEASASISWMTVQGVKIPFASARLLLRLKQTYREKDSAHDREYLRELILEKSKKNRGAQIGGSPS